MKVKTSITLSRDIVKQIDSIVSHKKRSFFIEQAVIAYLKKTQREARDRKDIEMINQFADELNKEAKDVLKYQVKI